MAIFQLDGVVSALSPGAAGKDRLAIDYLEISGGVIVFALDRIHLCFDVCQTLSLVGRA